MKRFWEKVDISGECWEWQGANRNGYGQFWLDGKIIYAHRFAYSTVHGIIPESMLICHHCDNPLCVKPSHLFLGTHSDNIQDAITKGKFNNRGEKHWCSKLVENDVYEIRRLHSLGVKQLTLTKMWRISQTHMGLIVRRKTWMHI